MLGTNFTSKLTYVQTNCYQSALTELVDRSCITTINFFLYVMERPFRAWIFTRNCSTQGWKMGTGLNIQAYQNPNDDVVLY